MGVLPNLARKIVKHVLFNRGDCDPIQLSILVNQFHQVTADFDGCDCRRSGLGARDREGSLICEAIQNPHSASEFSYRLVVVELVEIKARFVPCQEIDVEPYSLRLECDLLLSLPKKEASD